jgi:transcriptional regulator with XRE-family HTH domain
LERDQHTPRIETVERIACALGVSPCWLAFGEDGKDAFKARVPRQGAEARVPKPGAPLPFENRFAGCAARLRDRREAFGISLRELARLSGVSYQTIANIEQGRQVPRLDSVHRLAISLDVAPCWLAFGEGRKPGRVVRPTE